MVDTSNQEFFFSSTLSNHSTEKASRSDMAFHLRSISLPSRPHASETEVEQELLSLEASISSSSSIGTMCDGLRRLGNIYNGVEEIMCLPSNQACTSQQRKMLDGETESSLEALDLCNTMQEVFAEMNAIIQELQVTLRKGDDAAAQSKIQSYARLAKKAKKQFKKTVMKAISDKTECKMVMLLTKAREISISMLESTLHLLSKQIDMPKQSLVFKAFHKKKAVVCQEEQLQGLECSIRDLENVTGNLFRKLVQTRVSLLNILSS